MRVSPQKARLVLDLIKGQRVEAALNTLAFTNKRVAPLVHKLLRSALENANYASTEKGVDVDIDRLYVKRAVANDGPRMKRIRPAPMGRAYRYQRRMAHLEIAVAEKPKAAGAAGEAAAPAKPVARKAPAKKAVAKKATRPAKKAPLKKGSAKKKK
jgi:large subunit ribosomal protein L22